MALFVGAAHLISPALLFGPSRILHVPLIEAPSLRRITAVRLETRRGGRAAVADVFHARPGFLG
jgi:hypothetical protein